VSEGRAPGGWWRSLLAVVLVGGTVGGLFMTDDAWPFAPFRMFTTAPGPETRIRAVRFDAVTVTGEEIRLKSGHFGLRRAEIEGQLNSDRSLDDARMRALFENYNSRHHGDEQIGSLTLVLAGWRLEDGRPKQRISERKATWPPEG
jgi:hypothetical protein